MKFFEAVKTAAFSAKLFAAAGLSELFATALKANDETALKAHLAKFSDEANALDEAVAANAELETKLTALSTQLAAKETAHVALVTSHTSLVTALSIAGVKFEKPEDLKAALDSRISLKARELVAASGGPILDDTPGAADPTAPKAKQDPALKGMARVVAAFKAQSAAATAKRN